MKPKKKKKPTWKDLKQELVELDNAQLLKVIQDLYSANKDNQTFLHARFGIDSDILDDLKEVIKYWVCPKLTSTRPISVAKARKTISDYQKATGKLAAVAELSVYYCEVCARFLSMSGMEDDSYFNALIYEYGHALETIAKLEEPEQEAFLDRLEQVQYKATDWGWGMADAMSDLRCKFDDEQEEG